MNYGEVRVRPEHARLFEDCGPLTGIPSTSPVTTPTHAGPPGMPRRLNIDPAKVERGLTQLVLSLLELVRQLVEKQALRRIDGGSLTAAQVEEVGLTLMRLQGQMLKYKEQFGIEDLNLDLGPLGKLVDE